MWPKANFAGRSKEIRVPRFPICHPGGSVTALSLEAGGTPTFAIQIISVMDDERRLFSRDRRSDLSEGPLLGVVAILDFGVLDAATGVA